MPCSRNAAVIALASSALILSAPAFAHPGGGMPSGFPGGGMTGGGFPGNTSRGPWGSGGSFDRPGPPQPTSHSSTNVLDNNPHLVTSLSSALGRSGIVLPAGGLKAACQGFSNLGKCVATLHVAQNLQVAGGFDALKGLMTTGDKLSLGKAIQKLDPNADSNAAVKTAAHQANREIEAVGNDNGG